MASRASILAGFAGVSGLLATSVVLTGVLGATDGCTDLRCDGSFVRYGADQGQGALTSPTTWESSSFEGTWLDFSHQRTISFDLQAQIGPRRIVSVTPYIAASENPAGRSGSTIASGNLAVIGVASPGTFTVHNDTCADYFVRVVAELEPEAPVSTVGDASVDDGASADAGAPDVSAEAPGDAADSASDGP